MAIIAYSVRDTRVGICLQSAWGTAIADTAAFGGITGAELDCESFIIDRDLKRYEGLGAHNTRIADTADVTFNQYEALPKCTIKGLALNGYLSLLLYGFFQNVTEDSATPYSKAFSFHNTQPDFSVNSGAYYTIINRAPNASASEKIKDAIINSLEFSIEPGGQLMYSASFIARGGVTTNSNPSGTWTRFPKVTSGIPDYWSYAKQVRHTCNFGSGATTLQLTGPWTLSLTQDIIPVGQSGNGDVQTFAITNKRGKLKGKLLWDVNSASAINNLIAGTVSTFNIGWGSATPGTTNGDLDFILQGKFAKVDRDNAEVFGIDYEFDIMGTIASSTSAITVTHADATDRNW